MFIEVVVGGIIFHGVAKALNRSLVPKFQMKTYEKLDIPKSKRKKTALQKNIKDKEKQINQYLVLSGISIGLTTVGLFVRGFTILGGILTFYVAIPGYFWPAYQSIVQEKELRIAVADSILILGAMVTGHYITAALSNGLFYISRKFLLKTEDVSQQKLINLYGIPPHNVWIVKDEVEIEIPFSSLQHENILVISAGQTILVDGTVVEGKAQIDQHVLTGESAPILVQEGNSVLASSIIVEGKIQVKVEKTSQETVAAQIAEILQHTADYKMKIQSRGEAIADKEVIPRLLIGVGTLPFLGPSRALTAMNANFGWNMRILAPVGMLVFLSKASRHGILVKDGRSLELLNQVNTVVFDKTGTLTEASSHVGAIHIFSDITEDDLLSMAAAAELKQPHPIAQAIVKKAKSKGLQWSEVKESQYEIGYGLIVKLKEMPKYLQHAKDSTWPSIRIGSAKFMEKKGIKLAPKIQQIEMKSHQQGYSTIYLAIEDELQGIFEIHPTLRPEVMHTIQQLKKRGLQLYILSGDREPPTRQLAESLELDGYFADVLPEQKAEIIAQLQQEGKFVCYIGDGINDSIALKQAQVSISLQGASSIATDTAQVILMDGRLDQIVHLLELTDEFDLNLKFCFATSITPGVLALTGAFTSTLSIAGSMVLNQVALFIGVGKLIIPLIIQTKK